MAQPVWLRGPVVGVPALLQPVAHALLQANEDIQNVVSPLANDVVWARPGGAASIGFHATHALGSLDRLFTYARGKALSDEQRAALNAEKGIDRSWGSASDLASLFGREIDRAVGQLRTTSEAELLLPREVGRGRLPSTVIGLLVHAAEHTAGHVAQIVTTAKIITGAGLTG